MNVKVCAFLACGLWVLVFGVLNVRAQQTQVVNLQRDMTHYDVLKLWGPPDEKRERETKREDVWVYGDLEVFFQDGKVVAWSKLSGEPNATESVTESSQSNQSSEANAQISETTANKTTVTKLGNNRLAASQPAPAVAEILGEIMREVPNEERAGATAPGAPRAGFVPPRPGEPFRPDIMPR